MSITAELHIKAPIEKVFEYFSDLSKIEERIHGIEKVEILSDATTGEGAQWRETRVMFGKEATEEMQISHFNAPQSYEVTAASHGMKYHSTYSFAEQDDGTMVTLVFTGTPTSLMTKLTSPVFSLFFKNITKKAFYQDMRDLKTLLEK